MRGLNVPQVLLPAPSQICHPHRRIRPQRCGPISSRPSSRRCSPATPWAASPGFVIAILVDRSPFLKRGLLPIGNFVSALPIIGIAPIMVMWFGFDWQSKAAVIVCITFFPMLVNTVAGLNAAGRMERDMMRTYAANLLADAVQAAAPGRGARSSSMRSRSTRLSR